MNPNLTPISDLQEDSSPTKPMKTAPSTVSPPPKRPQVNTPSKSPQPNGQWIIHPNSLTIGRVQAPHLLKDPMTKVIMW
jgi:hypothetical protein